MNRSLRRILTVSLTLVILPSWVFAEVAPQSADCHKCSHSSEYVRLPEVVVSAVSGLLVIGGSVVFWRGSESTYLWGLAAIAAGILTQSMLQDINGHRGLMILHDDGSVDKIKVVSVLDSVEANSLFISRGLGQVETMSDIAFAAGMTSNELAFAIISAKQLGDQLTGDNRIAPEHILVKKSDVDSKLSSLNLKQQKAAANYLLLRNIQILN